MNLSQEYNNIIIKEKNVCWDGNSYLKNLQEDSEKKINDKYNKNPGS